MITRLEGQTVWVTQEPTLAEVTSGNYVLPVNFKVVDVTNNTYKMVSYVFDSVNGARRLESEGGSSIDFIEVTKNELDTHINNQTLIPGVLYAISQVDPNLYGGTTIYLTAINEDTISENGIGEFYNPKYDQSVAGFNVWSPNPPLITPLVSFGSHYNIGDRVHWGGKTWINLNGNVGNSIDIFTLDSEWQAIPYNADDYNKVYDEIKYDYDNDVIIYRNEKNSNIVSTNYVNITEWIDGWEYYNPIKVFMWGNTFNYALWVGIGNQKIIDSYNENINFRGLNQQNLTFSNGSYQQNLTFSNGSYQQNLTFSNGSYQQNLTFSNGSYQYHLTFDNNSYQQNLTFDNNSYQQNLTFGNNSYQRDLTFENTSSQENLTFGNNSYQQNLAFENTSGQISLNFTNSYQSNLTFQNSSFQRDLTFENLSYQTNLTFDNSSQSKLTFQNSSFQRDLTFENGTLQEFLKFEHRSFQMALNFSNGARQQTLTFGNNSYQQNLTFDNSHQYNLTFNNESYQTNLTFNQSSTQYRLKFDNNSSQDELTFYIGNQGDLTFDNDSNQRNLNLNLSTQVNFYAKSGGQHNITLENGSAQHTLTFNRGYQLNLSLNSLKQVMITLTDFINYDRTNNQPTADEVNLNFIGNLSEANSPSEMIVYEGDQIKKFPISNTNNLKYSEEEKFLGSDGSYSYYGKSFYWELIYEDYYENITENVYFDLTDLNIDRFLEVSGTKQVSQYYPNGVIDTYGEVQQMIAGVNFSVTNQAIFHTFNHTSPVGIQNITAPNNPRRVFLFFSIVYTKG